ncbi:Alpha/Beta hydrolase protein [Xylariales sp. PMI_506]|nr:Alpha/Beta hydrolase protein [Xylariales sp. PMI_506]
MATSRQVAAEPMLHWDNDGGRRQDHPHRPIGNPQLLGPGLTNTDQQQRHQTLPLVICFHGSGDSCASWLPLARILSESYRVLLWDRGYENPKPDVAVGQMLQYLTDVGLAPPYVLIAHSYGGTFARTFLQQCSGVAGMVLAETGQETPLDAGAEEAQYRKRVLGRNPVSVIRCNIAIAKWARLEEEERKAAAGGGDGGGEADRARLEMQRKFLEAHDRADEALKKQQLRLSSNTHYVHIPDCGHDVVKRRPEVVAREVDWVMANLAGDKVGERAGLRQRLSDLFSQILCK